MALPLDIGGLPREIQIPFEQVQKEHPFGTEDLRNGAVTDVKLATRTIRGMVNADGTVGRGTGFTSAKLATGDYRVTFTTAFVAIPVFLAFVGTTAGAIVIKGNGAEAPTTTTYRLVAFTSTAGANADSEFHFIAISV